MRKNGLQFLPYSFSQQRFSKPFILLKARCCYHFFTQTVPAPSAVMTVGARGPNWISPVETISKRGQQEAFQSPNTENSTTQHLNSPDNVAIINAALMHSDANDSFEKDLQRALWKWTWATKSWWDVTRTNLTEQTPKESLNDLLFSPALYKPRRIWCLFKPPPLSCAASTVQGKKIWKKQNILHSEDHSVTSLTLPPNSANCLGVSVMRLQECQQNLQRKTLPFILFHLLVSQVFSKG